MQLLKKREKSDRLMNATFEEDSLKYSKTWDRPSLIFIYFLAKSFTFCSKFRCQVGVDKKGSYWKSQRARNRWLCIEWRWVSGDFEPHRTRHTQPTQIPNQTPEGNRALGSRAQGPEQEERTPKRADILLQWIRQSLFGHIKQQTQVEILTDCGDWLKDSD